MQIPMFKAKDRDSDKIVEGFYFNYPLTTNKNADENGGLAIENGISHCIITYQPSASGLGFINEPIACTIDLGTLEFDKFVDIPTVDSKIIL